MHKKELPGIPDIVLSKHRTVIFIHGCFWHRHADCKFTYTPKSRVDFWAAKFDRNVERDIEVKKELEELGWNVITIWECETSSTQDLEKTLSNQLLNLDQVRSDN